LLAASAWTAPVIVVATAAPVFAASCLDAAYAITWGSSPYTRSLDESLGVATATSSSPSALPVLVTFARVMSGLASADAVNLTVPATTNVGGLGATARALALAQSMTVDQASRDNRQTVTITFPLPVTNVTFHLSDIDSNDPKGGNNGFRDRVELSSGFTFTAPSPSTVIGTGVSGDPWRQSNNNDPLGVTSGTGLVRVNYAGPTTSITLTYWNAQGPDYQTVFLSNLTFTAAGC